jgi:hypothetical protein
MILNINFVLKKENTKEKRAAGLFVGYMAYIVLPYGVTH